MKMLRRFGHSLIYGCQREEREMVLSRWGRLFFPLLTALSVAWFLVRVIPKPIRATYPCQQAAFPLLSGFVIWLLGLKSALAAWLAVKWRGRQFRPGFVVAGGMLVLGLVAWAAEKAADPPQPRPKALTYGSPSGDPPNSPMGLAKGIFPGRVTWMRDTNATPWDGYTGYWWQDTTGINQVAVDRMISMSLRGLTGATSDAEAWEKVFQFYNSSHNRGTAGYVAGELIALKINLNNNSPGNSGTNNYAEASKQTVLSLLRQLVHQAGVPQTNITVYDAVRDIPAWLSQPCRLEFPSVQWSDADGTAGPATTWVTNSSTYSITNGCGGPLVVASCASRATYLINLPLLKGHGYSGVTLAGKNHYGSIPAREHGPYLASSQTTQALYSPLVDLTGTRQLGDKTILYVSDGLFGNSAAGGYNGRSQCAFTNLFNGQWSASIFMSFDPVSIDSVCVDFLYAEFGLSLGRADDCYWNPALNCDHYLHEAALANNPPSGTVYRPDGVRLASLGAHEHWNNPVAKQYSRNLSTNGTGIELVAVHDLAAQLSLVSPTNGAVFAPGNSILLQVTPNAYAPLARVDYFANGLRVGTSTNAPFGSTWTNPPAGHWGLSATGTDAYGYGCTSAVVNVTVQGVSVAITNPPGGAVFPEGTNLTVQALAGSDFGSITQVTFYANGTLLGSRASAPYSVVWSNVPAGSWSLTATARDATGLNGSSPVINVTALRDIRVALTAPLPGAVFPAGANLTLSATAACPLTAISRVDFYDSGTWVGRADTGPYSVLRSNALAGVRSLCAVATETAGFSATSAVVKVSVVPKQPMVAGTLYVDLRATNFSPGGIWVNQGALGDFGGQWPYPTLETNAAATGLPGVWFNGYRSSSGPSTVPDIDGSSDRSIEVWALEPAPLGTSGVLVSSGGLGYGASFSAAYGTAPASGAFAQGPYGDPCNSGWLATSNVPPPGVWHHLVYVYDGATQLSVYVDGLLTIARTLPYPLSTWQSTPIVIGGAAYWLGGSYDNEFNGYINAVRVHGGILSPSDVWVNYLLGPVQWQPTPVTILSQPSDIVVPEQGSALLTVVPDGVGPFSFQWYRAGAPFAGATVSTCTLTNLQWADSGSQFFCTISPAYYCPSCTTTSRTAIITVQPALPATFGYAAVASEARFGFNYTTVPGGHYQVEYKDNLDALAWTPMGPASTAPGTFLQVWDSGGFFTNRHRFYRVVRLP
jgi:hypothetical protein